MKKEEGIIIVVLAILCLLFAKSSAEETTILIDDFSSATGRVVSYSQSDFNKYCAENCLEQTLCKNQSSSTIPGGFRYSSSQIVFQHQPNQFSWKEEGFIEVSNNTWESSVNITNNGTTTWEYINFSTTLSYISPCDTYSNDISMNLFIGGGNYIAVNFETISNVNASIDVAVYLTDLYNTSTALYIQPSMYDSEIGQYLIEIDPVDYFDYSKIIEFKLGTLFYGGFSVTPNDFISYSIKISNLRIISNSNGETSQASSQSSLSSKSSLSSNKSSQTSISSKSSKELSSDSSLTISFFSFYLLIVILFFIY